MRKTLFVLALALVAIFAIAADRAPTDDYGNGAAYSPPSGLKSAPQTRRIYLTDNDATDATDTIAADEAVIYGPYRFEADRYKRLPDAMSINIPATTVASGDSLQIGYQVVPDSSVADTITTWTVVDTVADPGKTSFHSLDSVVGSHIFFRIYAVDETEIQISKPISATLRERRE